MDSGRARPAVIAHWQAVRGAAVHCSPHLFLPDGTDVPNPGITARWVNGDFGVGFPVIDREDPTVYRDLLNRAAAVTAA